jgi:serine protease AprX
MPARGDYRQVAALILQADPSLSPDNVKCRVIASARLAVHADGALAYSPL